ncbi:MAG: NnrS family protein [Acidobacteria bacterium]|nr:NnrS family protein [Acidobacteriota bacterium]
MTNATRSELDLPEQWRAALERDRLDFSGGNDPAPERRAGRMLAAFVVTGLVFLALPGTLLGVWNLLSIAEHRTSSAVSVAWIQAHGQAQLFGWVGTFILGISLYVLPKFLGRPMIKFGLAWTVWGLWTAGIAWRWWSGVNAQHWRIGLAASAILELAAFVISQYALWFARGPSPRGEAQKKMPVDLPSWLGLVGFLSLGLALVLNLAISIDVIRNSQLPVYPVDSDRVFLLTALWGFAVPVAWSYSTRFVTIFLSLERPAQSATAWLTAGVLAVVASAVLHQFLLADLLALIFTMVATWALRVFRPSVRAPKRTGVYPHYDAFVRLAYAWLIVGATLGVLSDLLPDLAGLGGASRHAVTVGFLATLIFSIGPRILPSFLNGRELRSPRLMSAALWLVSLGCLLRVSSESIAYSATGISWEVLPISALLELSAVVIFVINMGMTLSQPVPAWFGPGGVAPHLPLYFYVTSFPKSKRVLVDAGLRTLDRVRDVPRSLTLQEAAEGDSADIQKLQAALRAFFEKRQPRQRRANE